MNMSYWPVELQEEIKRHYFYVPEEGSVHKYRYTREGRYDMGVVGTRTKGNRYITVFNVGGKSFCFTMAKLAMFLATGKQYKSVRYVNGNESDLSLENLIPLGPPLVEDSSELANMIAAQMKETIGKQRIKRFEMSKERTEQGFAELEKLKADNKANRLARQPSPKSPKLNEPTPQPADERIRESEEFQYNFKSKHMYWQVRQSLAGEELKLLEANQYLNGLYTDISWEDAQKWAKVVQANVGMTAEEYVLKHADGKTFSEIREMVEKKQIGKLESDYYYFCGVWFAYYKYDDQATAKVMLRDYKWLDQEWMSDSKTDEYMQLELKVQAKLADYYESQGVSSHEEMLAKIQRECDEAETLFNRNKVQQTAQVF